MLRAVLGLILVFVNANASSYEPKDQVDLLFFGAFFMMLIYNLGYYFIIRSITYLYYLMFHTLVFIIMLFYTDILSDTYLEFSMHSVPVGLFFIATATLLAFSRSFLELKTLDKRLSNTIDTLIYVSLALFFFSSFENIALILEDFAVVFVILVAAALLGGAIYLSLIRNRTYAYFYLFGFSSLFLIAGFVFLSHFNLLALSSYTSYLFEFAILFEAVVFSFAISYKHKQTIERLKWNKEMFKELSHRVKNNLQSVIVFVNDQQEKSKDAKLNGYLQDIINKVFTMGLIYKKLQNSEEPGKVNMAEYLQELMDLYQKEHENITFTVECDSSILMEEQTLTNLNAIIHELITNSIKHAFKNIETPTIFLSFHKDDMNYLFVYEDNGNGFENAQASQGTATINNYSNLALCGKNEVDSHGKYHFSLSFPKK